MSKHQELQVIGAGAARTGTTSLKAALEILGFGPCYHMEVVVKEDHQDRWAKALNGKSLESYKDILDGYASVLDFPASVAYQELMEAYPNAKVILSTRSPEGWAKSVIETVFSKNNRARSWVMAPWNLHHRRQAAAVRSRFFGSEEYRKTGALDDPEALATALQAWDKKVIDSVPADRLLVFKAGDGWEPLCKFLNVPVPATEFPFKNEGKSFQNRHRKYWMECLVKDIACALGAVSVATVAAIAFSRRRG